MTPPPTMPTEDAPVDAPVSERPTIPTRPSRLDHLPPDEPPTDDVIWAEGLSKQFNDEMVVQDVDLAIPRGAIFGFIGPSGSGKTTTLRLLMGIYQPTSGKARILGHEPHAFNRNIRARIGYMPQLFVLYPDLTVWENMNFAASIYGMSLFRSEKLHQVLQFVELDEHRDKLARNISGGMQRRLSLASTLVHDPDVIFLDEPTAGVDPVLRRKFWDHFRELQEQGRTLFITTQYVTEAAYCDMVGVIANGRLLVVDTPDGLRRQVYGGEIIEVRTTNPVPFQNLQRLRQLPFVIPDRVTRLGDTGLRLIVEDAGVAIPELTDWFRAEGYNIESIEEYLPPFDDVFVELVQGEERIE
jgi:ABC-2 type transport system ATP-binding protein